MTQTDTPPRRPGKSTGAIFLGFLAGAGLSLGTDEVLHLLKIYPPWGQPMYDPGLNFLALAYRMRLRRPWKLRRRKARASQSDAARDDFRLNWVRSLRDRCYRHERDGFRPTVVSDFARRLNLALRLAGRAPPP
jgi:hypothetical protein